MNKEERNYFWSQEDWHSINKENLSDRKREWRYIQHNLKFIASTEIRGAYLKHHKKLFFDGDIDPELLKKSGGYPFAFLLPFFVLWYHPNLNNQVLERVMSHVCETPTNVLSLSKAREMIRKIYMQSGSKLKAEYGFLGTKTKIMVNTLWGQPLVGTKFDQLSFDSNPGFETSKMMLESQYVSSFFWSGVLKGVLKGSIHPGQYLFEHAMSVSDSVTRTNYIQKAASHILYYDESTSVAKDNIVSQEIRDLMIMRYENGEFHPTIQTVWDDVKAGNKLFEVN